MLIFNGRGVLVPNCVGQSFQGDRKLVLANDDWRPRPTGSSVHCIVMHTRMGMPVKFKPGDGPNTRWDEDLPGRFAKDDRKASCHVAIDGDGSYACYADILKVAAFHAGHVNDISMGIEMYQDAEGHVYGATIETALAILDVATRELGVQRQFVAETAICRRIANNVRGPSHATSLAYVASGGRGRDWNGILGHRNVTRNRGPGDPGDDIFARLSLAGYETFYVDQDDDLIAWERRQRVLGIKPEDCDGQPGHQTRACIAAQRRGGPGLWVERPGDYADGVSVAE